MEQIDPESADAPRNMDIFLLTLKEIHIEDLRLKTFRDKMDGLGAFTGAFIKGASGSVYFLTEFDHPRKHLPERGTVTIKCSPVGAALAYKFSEVIEILRVKELDVYWANPLTGRTIDHSKNAAIG
jgi:hypothetical protein